MSYIMSCKERSFPRAAWLSALRGGGKEGNKRNASGFTLVEVLMASLIASAFLAPLSFWLYKSRLNQAAMEKFQAGCILETYMHRAFLLRLQKPEKEEFQGQKYYSIIIEPRRDGPEVRLEGRIENKGGRILTSMTLSHFTDSP